MRPTSSTTSAFVPSRPISRVLYDWLTSSRRKLREQTRLEHWLGRNWPALFSFSANKPNVLCVTKITLFYKLFTETTTPSDLFGSLPAFLCVARREKQERYRYHYVRKWCEQDGEIRVPEKKWVIVSVVNLEGNILLPFPGTLTDKLFCFVLFKLWAYLNGTI